MSLKQTLHGSVANLTQPWVQPGLREPKTEDFPFSLPGPTAWPSLTCQPLPWNRQELCFLSCKAGLRLANGLKIWGQIV